MLGQASLSGARRDTVIGISSVTNKQTYEGLRNLVFSIKKSTKSLLLMLTLFLLSMGPNFVSLVLKKEVLYNFFFFEMIL